ncbi:hypothetical protein [Streptomyces sp. NPDC047061]|uniref:terpene synthase family protein n=1 Tax=Streptomyces sp. NPDC047061 TaxID=3154605 RepID=UPI0033DF82E1
MEHGYHELVALAYPTADFRELELIGKVVVWGFLYDDRFDTDRLGGDASAARSEAYKVARVLLGDTAPGTDVWLSSLAGVREQAASIMAPALLRRLTFDLVTFAYGVAEEVEMRARGEIPSTAKYLRLRMETFAWRVLVDLAEVAEGTELPDVVSRSPEYRALLEASGRVMCWTNDLHSLQKELRSGEQHNMVLVLRRQRGGTLEDSEAAVLAMMSDEIEQFAEYQAALTRLADRSRLTAADRARTARFTERIQYLMSGQNAWCAATVRYRDPAAAEQGSLAS